MRVNTLQQNKQPTGAAVGPQQQAINSQGEHGLLATWGCMACISQHQQLSTDRVFSAMQVKQVAAAAATQRLYEWSRQLDAALVESLPELQLQPSPGESVQVLCYPADSLLRSAPTVCETSTNLHTLQALVTKLAAAADGGAATAPSSSTTPTSNSHTLSASSVDAILQQLPASTLSTQLTAPQAATLLASLARLRAQVPASWLEAVLAGPLAGEAAVQACSTRQIAEATWAVSELCEASGPGSAVMAWATSLLAAVVPHLADFYAPDLAALVGSCGALHRCVNHDLQLQGGCDEATEHQPVAALGHASMSLQVQQICLPASVVLFFCDCASDWHDCWCCCLLLQGNANAAVNRWRCRRSDAVFFQLSFRRNTCVAPSSSRRGVLPTC